MVPRRRTVRKYRKRGIKKRKRVTRVRRRNAKVLYCPSACPDKMRVKLSFATAGTHIVSGISSPQVIIATQHNPFGTAVEPQGWDQWGNMYLSWRPLGMALKIRVGVLDNNLLNAGCNVRGYWSQYSSPPGSDLAIIQNRYTKILELTPQSGWKMIKTYSKLHNVWGLTRRQWMCSENTYGATNSDPPFVTRYFFHCNCPYWTAGNNFNIGYEIVGDMYVEFFNPRIMVDG